MKRIYIASEGSEDWKRLLADPEKHWRTGYSAKSLAYCWENAAGFPPEVARLFEDSGISRFKDIEPLLILPEYQVPLPGGSRPSQSDLFVLAKAQGELVSITIEGKVSESFGPTLGDWLVGASQGKLQRLAFLKDQLGLAEELPPGIRYQLLHRTASAIIEAKKFNARSAVMLVYSFSQSDECFDDYQALLGLFGAEEKPDELVFVRQTREIGLYCGWVRGDARYLEA
jgi:hypothetical protein